VHALLTIYCASVSPNLRCVSTIVRRMPASISANVRRKWHSIARRAVHHCAPLRVVAEVVSALRASISDALGAAAGKEWRGYARAGSSRCSDKPLRARWFLRSKPPIFVLSWKHHYRSEGGHVKIELTPDAAQWVQAELAAGRFPTAEDAIRHAINQAKLLELRRACSGRGRGRQLHDG
jgi:hypothetical protein